MSGALRAEIRKITTTRLWWILLICVFVIGGGYAALTAIVAIIDERYGPRTFSDQGIVQSIYHGGNTFARVLAMVVGISAVGSEHRHHTLASTYLATPHRLRSLLAKAVTLLIFGLVYGVVSVAAGMAVAVPFVLTHHGSLFLGDADTWRSVALGVLSIGLWALLGMGIGILIKNVVVAMLVGIGFAFLVEPVLAVWFFFRAWDLPLNLIPTGATNAMLGSTSWILFGSTDPLPWWQALLVLAGWCLVPAIVGVLLTVRSDVTD